MKKYRYVYELNDRNNLVVKHAIPSSKDNETIISDDSLSCNILFLDIETTGFQRTSTFLTIIGLAWQEGEQFIIEQWFNETGHQEEPVLLIELERFLKQLNQERNTLPLLVHYNGTTFDLPYLKAKYEQYHLPATLPDCPSLDLYHLAKKFRDFLSLDGLKQKNLEECFGLFREDQLSGQELIDAYLSGIKYKDCQLLDDYLLHNKEDMEGMVFLQNLLKLNQVFEGNFNITEWTECKNSSSVLITISADFSLYKPIRIYANEITYHFETGMIEIQIPICSMEARFFYENHKDYYYLPAEDCAIHKSVAEYVEKEHRIKATKATCYTKKTAEFLPLPLPSSSRLKKAVVENCCSLNLFYQCYGDCTAYILKETSNECAKSLYAKHLLQALLR